MFFPPPYASHSEARSICSGCPVRVECVADALDTHENAGIRGGFSFTDVRGRRRASQWLADRLKSRHDQADTSVAS